MVYSIYCRVKGDETSATESEQSKGIIQQATHIVSVYNSRIPGQIPQDQTCIKIMKINNTILNFLL